MSEVAVCDIKCDVSSISIICANNKIIDFIHVSCIIFSCNPNTQFFIRHINLPKTHVLGLRSGGSMLALELLRVHGKDASTVRSSTNHCTVLQATMYKWISINKIDDR